MRGGNQTKIHIHRGQNQIGGSIIEVQSDTTRIVLDVGSELEETVPAVPSINGLFQGRPAYDAVFITHYHGDHVGLLEQILPEIPIYMGERAYNVHRTAKGYLGQSVREITHFLCAGEQLTVGNISVTPLLCDHSAFDSYMLLVECEGKKLLYTGDFRSNGRKDFSSLLIHLPIVDAVVIEGTTLSGCHSVACTEGELEKRAVELITQHQGKPIFIYQAATNIDRLVTFYRAAKRTQRVFLEDVYTASIASAAGKTIPHPVDFPDVRVFLTAPSEKQYTILQQYGSAKIGRDAIARTQFVMCVRSSMENYLEKLSHVCSFVGGCFIYSMWNGYLKDDSTAKFVNQMIAKGLRVEYLHTSGHADLATLDQLMYKINPRYIIPVHTENPRWFERYVGSEVVYSDSIRIQ